MENLQHAFKQEDITQAITLLNIFDLLGISLVIFLAFGFQFLGHELPCPLCLMQRLGLLAMGFGFLLNIHYPIRPVHYTLIMLSAIYTGAVAMRQILLHIVPGTGGYGPAIFGLHLYTWTFIMCVGVIIWMCILLSFPAQYLNPITPSKNLKRLGHIGFFCFMLMLILNITATYFECGFKACPANPVSYQVKI